MAWVARDKAGKILVYEFDPLRTDLVHFNIIEVPEKALAPALLKDLKKSKEPINLNDHATAE